MTSILKVIIAKTVWHIEFWFSKEITKKYHNSKCDIIANKNQNVGSSLLFDSGCNRKDFRSPESQSYVLIWVEARRRASPFVRQHLPL